MYSPTSSSENTSPMFSPGRSHDRSLGADESRSRSFPNLADVATNGGGSSSVTGFRGWTSMQQEPTSYTPNDTPRVSAGSLTKSLSTSYRNIYRMSNDSGMSFPVPHNPATSREGLDTKSILLVGSQTSARHPMVHLQPLDDIDDMTSGSGMLGQEPVRQDNVEKTLIRRSQTLQADYDAFFALVLNSLGMGTSTGCAAQLANAFTIDEAVKLLIDADTNVDKYMELLGKSVGDSCHLRLCRPYVAVIVNSCTKLIKLNKAECRQEVFGVIEDFVSSYTEAQAKGPDRHADVLFGWWLPLLLESLAFIELGQRINKPVRTPKMPDQTVLRNATVVMTMLAGRALPNSFSSVSPSESVVDLPGEIKHLTEQCRQYVTRARSLTDGVRGDQVPLADIGEAQREGRDSAVKWLFSPSTYEGRWASAFLYEPIFASVIGACLKYIPPELTQSLLGLDEALFDQVPRTSVHLARALRLGPTTKQDVVNPVSKLRHLLDSVAKIGRFSSWLLAHWPSTVDTSNNKAVSSCTADFIRRQVDIFSLYVARATQGDQCPMFNSPEVWVLWKDYVSLLSLFEKVFHLAASKTCNLWDVKSVLHMSIIHARFTVSKLLELQLHDSYLFETVGP
eukprot:TRINITY_DN5421_c0_g1_i1.p1 TRINITY_DN5421_c0_g1~~TRINITY_DN5421_c0_g1_i1.p1  ORF type:complete len:622 (-),score=101.41 TRINITY_DN5421_c0_g1_i1:115-1980(-)